MADSEGRLRRGLIIAAAVLVLYNVTLLLPFVAGNVLVVSVLWMLALSVAAWQLGPLGGAAYGVVFTVGQLGAEAMLGLSPDDTWGSDPNGPSTLAWLGLSIFFSIGIGWLVGAVAKFSRSARLRAAELAAKNAELERIAAALSQSEEMFRLFAERIDVAAWIQPLDGTKHGYQNPAGRRLFGPVASANAQEERERYFRRLHPLDQPAAAESFARLYRGEAQDIEYREVEGGQIRWIRSQAFPILGKDGAIVSIVGLAEDITERKDREARRESIERRERLSSLGTLVAGVAHEVNNPLTYLVGTVQLARKEIGKVAQEIAQAAPDEAQRLERVDKLLASSKDGGDRIARIVRALRAVTQHRSDAERENVSLNAIASNVNELIRVGLPHDVTLETTLDPSDPHVLARSDELHQVVLNLANNAIQAIGERSGHVRVAVGHEGGHAVVKVSDDGPGIPESVRAKLFTPFFTTKPEGTGLGLSIVHAIVRGHDGDIDVESEPGHGAEFRARFPLAVAAPALASPRGGQA